MRIEEKTLMNKVYRRFLSRKPEILTIMNTSVILAKHKVETDGSDEPSYKYVLSKSAYIVRPHDLAGEYFSLFLDYNTKLNDSASVANIEINISDKKLSKESGYKKLTKFIKSLENTINEFDKYLLFVTNNRNIPENIQTDLGLLKVRYQLFLREFKLFELTNLDGGSIRVDKGELKSISRKLKDHYNALCMAKEYMLSDTAKGAENE